MADEDDPTDLRREALDAERLKHRMAAILSRTPKTVPVPRDDGTILLHGRRRRDRNTDARDRRVLDRRRSEGEQPRET